MDCVRDVVGCGGRGDYRRWVFRRMSKIALGNIVWLPFKWLLEAYQRECNIVQVCLGEHLSYGNVILDSVVDSTE